MLNIFQISQLISHILKISSIDSVSIIHCIVLYDIKVIVYMGAHSCYLHIIYTMNRIIFAQTNIQCSTSQNTISK